MFQHGLKGERVKETKLIITAWYGGHRGHSPGASVGA